MQVQVQRVQVLVQVLEGQQGPLGAALGQVVAVGVLQQGAHLFALVVRVLLLVALVLVAVEVLALLGVVSVVVPGLLAVASVLPPFHPLEPVGLVSGNPERHRRHPLERWQICLVPL